MTSIYQTDEQYLVAHGWYKSDAGYWQLKPGHGFVDGKMSLEDALKLQKIIEDLFKED